MSTTDEDSLHDTSVETASLARSTLYDALLCPTCVAELDCPDGTSTVYTVNPIPHSIGSKPLSSTSRAIIKQCFEETTPIELLKGHPTVSTEQISNILRIFVDEIAGASLEKLNCVVQRVSRLSLHSLPRRANLKGPEGHSDFETDTNIDSSSDITGTTRQGESTGVQTSDDETRRDNKSIISRPADHVQLNSSGCPSPGTITLATMKRETQQELPTNYKLPINPRSNVRP